MPRDKSAILIAERIRRCRYCEAEMNVSALAYEENPYCVKCLHERTRAASTPEELAWAVHGHYVEFFKKSS